jgi:hypothetical protein
MSVENPANKPVDAAFVSRVSKLTASELHHAYPKEYNSWKNAKQRSKSEGREFSGEFEQFRSFLTLMGPRPGEGYSLERIAPAGPYSAENCRWANHQTQSENRRNVVKERLARGEVTIAELARCLGLSSSRLYRARKVCSSAIAALLTFDPLNPWPSENVAEWKRIAAKGMRSDEHPVEFYERMPSQVPESQ